MIKTIELIVVTTLLIFAFFAGVKYSDSVKNHASWLFETRGEEEVELPDLSKENSGEIGGVVDENGNAAAPAGNQAAPQDNTPMDNIDYNQNQQPQAAPVKP